MRLFQSKSIRSRLFLTMIVAIIGVVTIAAIVWRFSIEPAWRMEVAKNQSEVARRAADQIDEFLEHRIAELLMAAEIGRFWEHERNRQKETLYRLLKLDPQVHEVSVADRRGKEILRLSRAHVYTDADLISLEGTEKFLQAIQGKIYIGKVSHARTAEPFVTLAVPLKFTATDVRGILSAEIALKTLWQSISHIKIGKSGHAFVVDQKGKLIAHPDYSKVLLGLNMAHLQEVKEFLWHPNEDPDFGEVVIGQDGKRVISTFSVVRRPHWAVIVEENVGTALAEVKQVERLAILISFFTLAGAFGLGYWFSERIARPVRKLEEGTRLISQGNLEHRLEIHTGDEIESLADQFNQMARALKSSYEGLEAKITERTKEISALYAALTPLARAGSLTEMPEKVIERLMEVTGADAALIRVRDKATGAFVCASQRGFPAYYLERALTLPPGAAGSALDYVFKRGEPLISANIAVDPRLKGKIQLEVGFQSCAYLPLKVGMEVRGIVHLASRKLGYFKEEMKDRLIAIAHQMGIAMENRELFEEAQRRAQELAALHAVATATSQSLKVEEVLQIALHRTLELVGRDAGFVRLKDDVTNELRLVAQQGLSESYAALREKGERVGWMAAKVLATGETLAINDPSPGDLLEETWQEGLRATVWVPVQARGQVVGVLTVASKTPRPFEAQEVELLKAIGSIVGTAVANARLFQETEQRAREQGALNFIATTANQSLKLDEIFDASLAKVLEVTGRGRASIRLKDPSTGELRLVAHRGLSQEEVETLLRQTRHKSSDRVLASGESVVISDTAEGLTSPVPLQRTRSVAWIPIRTRADVVGVLGVSTRQRMPFSPREVELLQVIGNIIGTAMERAQLFEETKRRAEKLQALNELTRLMNSSLSVQGVFDFIVQSLAKLLNAQVTRLWVFDSSPGVLRLKGAAGEPELVPYPQDTFRPGEGLVGSAFQSKEVVVITEPAKDPRYSRRDWAHKMGITHLIGVPILLGDQALGAISAAFRHSRPFPEEDISLVRAFADQAAIAIENARLFGETQCNLERIRALQEIDHAITSTLDLRDVLKVLLEKIDLLLPYSAATVRLLNKKSGLLEPVACRNLDEKEWKAEQWRGGRGIPNVVFETKAPWMVRNVLIDPAVRDLEFFRRHGLVSYLGLPLMVKDEVLGVISFYTREEHQFSGEEVEFLSTLAGQAAIAIHNSQLYEESRRQAMELERANKVKDEFLSVMSHELRTPLNVIMGFTGMIKDGMLGEINPEQERALEKVFSRSHELLSMVSGILEATRIEAEAVKVERNEVNLGHFLDELKSTYEAPLDKELTLIWDYTSELPVVETDSEKLKHILQNLINNAIKFTDKGSVSISARLTPHASRLTPRWVEFKVVDTGIGIAEEFFPIIFEKFRQVDSSETRPYEGVGLGLYIVKKFTKLLGGKVEMESEPGRGSTFTVTIPCESRQEVHSLLPSALCLKEAEI